ncbi:TOBE domain-containing protein [Oceanisphaera avium]|uniref:Mop domain-containing protein n=1 Tax=Oceanisphaera avium TaxID=1903694 RepID=A0A1Y0CVS9_9GAMM|nr:TOBE domain-containing protein [Oceanisphaera avium]ART78985.1 hypothetical protein CBP12_01505 [Oceanisphaera avium]
MKISARNQLPGIITEITAGAVNSEVSLRLANDQVLTAIITAASVEKLDLQVGKAAYAIIKASSVMLVTGTAVTTSARNQLAGAVSQVTQGAVNSEVILDMGANISIAAIITKDSCERLELDKGQSAHALIKASCIMLAVDA